jgi:hypothetical protein
MLTRGPNIASGLVVEFAALQLCSVLSCTTGTRTSSASCSLFAGFHPSATGDGGRLGFHSVQRH